MEISFTILEKDFTIHRYYANEPIPSRVYKCEFFWIGKTDEELSIVCESDILENDGISVKDGLQLS